MAKVVGGGKRALIDKANSAVVIAAGAAAFVCIFSLVASKTLLSQMAYQNHVISEKHKALKQLKDDEAAAKSLDGSYRAFTSTPQNALGGNPAGSGPQDGDNAKIVLDALPSSYDFPALVTSIEKLLNVNGASVGSITGSDDALNQASNQTSATPKPIPIPFSVSVSGDYASVQKVIGQFEHSIRPMQVQSLTLSGGQDKMALSLTLQTFYQPAKTLNIGTKVVK